MNTNDLPPAAKLAALIEAGVAANPDLTQFRGCFMSDNQACALGFAALALGVSRDELRNRSIDYESLTTVASTVTNKAFSDALGMRFVWFNVLGKVAEQNDQGEPIHCILTSLREGELAQVGA